MTDVSSASSPLADLSRFDFLARIYALSPEERRQHLVQSESRLDAVGFMPEDDAAALDKIRHFEELADLHTAQGEYRRAADYCEAALVRSRQRLGEDHPSTIVRFARLARAYLRVGEARRAEIFARHAHERTASHLAGASQTERAEVIEALGAVLRENGRYTEAAARFGEALALHEAAHGREHPRSAACRLQLAETESLNGVRASALIRCKEALVTLENVLGPTHPYVAEALLCQAGLETGETLPLLERALAIQEKALGPGHPTTAVSLAVSGTALRRAGQGEAGAARISDGIARHEATLGAEHTNSLYLRTHLAHRYLEDGELDRAVAESRRILEGLERTFDEHPQVAHAMANLAVARKEQGALSEASGLLKRAVDMYERLLPANHPILAATVLLLGIVYREQGHFAPSDTLLRWALLLREQHPDSTPVETANALRHLGITALVQARLEEAESLLVRALDLLEAFGKTDSVEWSVTAADLGSLYLKRQKYSDAEAIYRYAFSAATQRYAPDHREVGTTAFLLALAYQGQGQHAEAEPLLRRALNIYEQRLGLLHVETARLYTALSETLAALGFRAEAREMQITAELIRKELSAAGRV
jgi:tetratricopeptide (TPR) repeat protein